MSGYEIASMSANHGFMVRKIISREIERNQSRHMLANVCAVPGAVRNITL